MKPLSHPNEEQRLFALSRYGILDTPRESDFDDIVNLASEICGAPIATISLVDRSRQWFKAEKGLGVRETPLENSICAHAILQPDLFVVPDTTKDARFADNAFVTGEPHLRFYAGALLESSDKLPIGTLCVLDYEPRELTSFQERALRVLARQVMTQIELRQSYSSASVLLNEIDHRVKNSLQLVSSILLLHARSVGSDEVKEHLRAASDRVGVIADLHDHLRHYDSSDEIRVAEFLEKSLESLKGSMRKGLALHLDVDELTMEFKRVSSIGLLVNELVTNAIKHAFPGGRDGNIWVRVAVDGDMATLGVTDDGAPFSEPAKDSETSTRLGMRLSQGLAKSLEGELEMEQGEGKKTFAVRFPLPERR